MIFLRNQRILRILINHFSKIEKINAEFGCDKCDFQAESMSEFLMHVKSNHGEEKLKIFSCNHLDI